MGVLRATAMSSEPVMRESFVGFSHTMDFLALLHRTATALGRFLQLAGEAHHHRLLAALLRRLADPAHGERHATHRPHFHRHLVVGAADAPALHLDDRLHVLHRLREDLDRVLARLRLDLVQRAVDDSLGDRLLAARHQHVDELGDVDVVELRVGKNLPFRYFSATRHVSYPALGALAPYLERLCLRSFTPCVSSEPRTMW